MLTNSTSKKLRAFETAATSTDPSLSQTTQNFFLGDNSDTERPFNSTLNCSVAAFVSVYNTIYTGAIKSGREALHSITSPLNVVVTHHSKAHNKLY